MRFKLISVLMFCSISLLLFGCGGAPAVSPKADVNSSSTPSVSSPKPAGWEVGGGGDTYSGEFVRIAYQISYILKTRPILGITSEKLIGAIIGTKVISKEELTLDGRPVDAINHPHTSPPLIEISQKEWTRIGEARLEKVTLVLHEYLGVLEIDDKNYQISRRLDAPEVFGELLVPSKELREKEFSRCTKISEEPNYSNFTVLTLSDINKEIAIKKPLIVRHEDLIICLNRGEESPPLDLSQFDSLEFDHYKNIEIFGFGVETLPDGFFAKIKNLASIYLESTAPLRPAQYREINKMENLRSITFSDVFYYSLIPQISVLKAGTTLFESFKCETVMSNKWALLPYIYCRRN